jgi:hypothetical protein
MPIPRQHAEERLHQKVAESSISLRGDAHIAITAPFFPDADPLIPRDRCAPPAGNDLDGSGDLLRAEVPVHTILRGTLTYQQPPVEALTGFTVGAVWLDDLRADLELSTSAENGGHFDQVEVSGLLFPDGYGAVALSLRFPGGWESDRRAATLGVIGVPGREAFAASVRARLLPPLERMLRRSGAGESSIAVLPYFNLTYAGSTDHPTPGRSCLDDELRHLVYPVSPMPLPSCSPWHDEYLYAGYAYNVLAMKDPLPSLRQLTLLLLVLNVSNARLARLAAAADHALGRHDFEANPEWLTQTARRLRSEYQSLITPTFSFDHHALKIRDAILDSWDVPKLMDRADNLISMLRDAVELRMAEDQTRRIRKLNLVVFILTVLSTISTIEAALSIYNLLRK